MANNRFASVPNISIPRSRFKQPFNHSTSFMHGDFVPIDCFDILPGDTYKLDLSSLIWMSTPERPVFGNIWAHVSVYFVPMRLVWENTKEFFGENKTSSGYQTTSYKIPSIRLNARAYPLTVVGADSLSHYLGKPITGGSATYVDRCMYVSCLKERAYYEIWNNYVRSEQLQNPVLITYTGNGGYSANSQVFIGSKDGTALGFSSGLLKVNKDFDYFTAATLQPQYGPAVALPLGSYAPLAATNVYDIKNLGLTTDGVVKFGVKGESQTNTTAVPYFAISGTNQSSGILSMDHASYSAYDDMGSVNQTNLVADLSQATAATINSLRYAFAVQKFLERSNFGSRFFEMLEVHYGITSPDSTLQIPQRLGHADFRINVSTVLATTSGTDGTNTNDLGQAGAASCTANKSYMFTHSFTEPGFLFVMLSTTHERSYTQGILREDMKLDRYEIYSPEFANLGDQEIKNCEIFYGDDNFNDRVFGYQEHWAEYRYRMNRVSGQLDPQAPSSLDKWNLADDYGTTRPSLDGSWIVEDRAALARALYITDGSVPDYIGDFYFDYVATREMPLFTIPGLIDHFGTR